MFRDQSEQVMSKYQLPDGNAPPAVSSTSRGSCPSPCPIRLDPPLEPVASIERFESRVIAASLVPSMDDQATSFFFYKYVLAMSTCSTGYMQSLPEIYGSAPANSALATVIASLGLTALHNVTRSPQAMIGGVSRYNSALRSIAKAIQDPTEVRTDQTLMTVILLGLYEVWPADRCRSS